MADKHDCGDPDCEGLHGGMADMISAYERKEHPFEEDTDAQNVLRQTFPVPVILTCGAYVAQTVFEFVEELVGAKSSKDAAHVLHGFLKSTEIRQLADFSETMLLLRHAWKHCAIKDGKFKIADMEPEEDGVLLPEAFIDAVDEILIRMDDALSAEGEMN